MARQVLVQYKVKADRVEEHEALIRNVFAELAATKPEGIRYGAFKRADGVSFVHVALVTADQNPLDAIKAFKAFGERIKERCDEPPEVADLKPIGVFEL
ncbi:MAG TPA: hypothetical protein VH062_15485 [Polyangiaceae bacterium]|jgi:hypothetical protein|nr:hypothetical protein [Polyangiaceae bacterium]